MTTFELAVVVLLTIILTIFVFALIKPALTKES